MLDFFLSIFGILKKPRKNRSVGKIGIIYMIIFTHWLRQIGMS